jgi:hypothetical protein
LQYGLQDNEIPPTGGEIKRDVGLWRFFLSRMEKIRKGTPKRAFNAV